MRLWFRIWLLAQITLLPTLIGFCTDWASKWLRDGSDSSGLLPYLFVHWLLVLFSAGKCGVLAVANRSVIRRRILVVGMLPWLVVTLIATIVVLVICNS